MCSEHTDEEEMADDRLFSRRRVLATALTGMAGFNIPTATAATQKQQQPEEIISNDRKVIKETDEYILVKSVTVRKSGKTTTYLKEYTSGDKEGTISVLNSSAVAATSSDVSEIDAVEAAAASDYWKYVGDFDRFRETLFESCVDSSYGYHGWRGASVEFTLPIKHISTNILTEIVMQILEPLGLPELSTIAQFIVSLIASWTVQQFTMGGVDRDGLADVKYTQIKAARKWDADADEGSKAGKLPGVHLA